MHQELLWDQLTNECILITLTDEGELKSEELTPQEAAEWMAENKY